MGLVEDTASADDADDVVSAVNAHSIHESALITEVNTAFAETGSGYEPWPDPWPGRNPPDDAYSRLTTPEKWRILAARIEAWIAVLADHRAAAVERDIQRAVERPGDRRDVGTAVRWAAAHGPAITRIDRVVPRRSGALALIVAHTRLGDSPDTGVRLGVGDPAVEVGLFPDCGCDACDSGSQNELDHLDAHVLAVVSGRFRHLSRGGQTVSTLGHGTHSASGFTQRPNPAAVLANPKGWTEWSGDAWLALHPD